MGTQQLPPRSPKLPACPFWGFLPIAQELFGTPGISESSWSPRAPGCYKLASCSGFPWDFCPESEQGNPADPGLSRQLRVRSRLSGALAAARESRGFQRLPWGLGLAQLPPPPPGLAWEEEEGRETREGKGLSHPVSLILGGVGGRMCRSAASTPASPRSTSRHPWNAHPCRHLDEALSEDIPAYFRAWKFPFQPRLFCDPHLMWILWFVPEALLGGKLRARNPDGFGSTAGLRGAQGATDPVEQLLLGSARAGLMSGHLIQAFPAHPIIQLGVGAAGSSPRELRQPKPCSGGNTLS